MLAASIALAQPSATRSDTRLRQEVIDNILREPIGDHTVADLNLPADFVGRVADRILRNSYEDRFRIVVADPTTNPVMGPSPLAHDQKHAPSGSVPDVVGDDGGIGTGIWAAAGIAAAALALAGILRARRGRL